MPERCVVLFTKPAVPGRVKTRLVGDLTAAQAAELHAAFQLDLLERLRGGDFSLRIAWALDGRNTPSGPVPSFAQEGRDLGERLYNAFRRLGSRFRFVVAVGSDHPELSLARVEEAFERLEAGAEVAVGPAQDGGYYLLGFDVSRLDPGLFRRMPWSTERLLDVTLERCRGLGLRTATLPQVADVDTPEDLVALVGRLLEAPPSDCRHTRRLLREWGRLGR